VDLVTIESGGHTWPGSRFALPGLLFGRTCRSVSATRLILQFLDDHAP